MSQIGNIWLCFCVALSACGWFGSVAPMERLQNGLGFEEVHVPGPASGGDVYAMKNEVTQTLWAQIMGTNPSAHAACGEDCPVEQIGWLDAVAFANALSRKAGLSECYLVYPRGRGNRGDLVGWPTGTGCEGYRLPTDAEWLRLAWAGDPSRSHPWGEAPATCDLAVMNDQRSGPGCGDNTTAPVCSKSEGHNALGLCDVSGNVREWTWDDGPAGKDLPPRLRPKSVRGGSYQDGPGGQLITARMGVTVDGRSPAIGLRLVRSFHR